MSSIFMPPVYGTEVEWADFAFDAKFVDDAAPGTFEGYAAVFGNVDSHGDVIERGAFKESLRAREKAGRGLPPMYKMHGGRAYEGNEHEPIGVWSQMFEDNTGLYVKGKLIGLNTQKGSWNYAQLREHGLSGLSIAYTVRPGGSRAGAKPPQRSRSNFVF